MIGAPLYLLFRNKMIKESVIVNKPLKFYTKSRILKTTLLLAFLLSLFVLFNFLLILSIKSRGDITVVHNYDMVIFTFFILLTFLVSFGGGVYATAIVHEQYMLKPLKKIAESKVLVSAIDLSHGPVSSIWG